MKKVSIIFFMLVMVLIFSGCKNDPEVRIFHSTWYFDERNVFINVEPKYETDYYTPYEWVDTENGKDLIIHFVEVEE